MGFRFSRRIRVLAGVRLNLSKSGASVSLGGRGAWFTVGPKGTRTTVGIPGTGLSYTSTTSSTPQNTSSERAGSSRSGSARHRILGPGSSSRSLAAAVLKLFLR
jgi:hypothetical protein